MEERGKLVRGRETDSGYPGLSWVIVGQKGTVRWAVSTDESLTGQPHVRVGTFLILIWMIGAENTS